MKVEELIDILSDLPLDAEVCSWEQAEGNSFYKSECEDVEYDPDENTVIIY